MYNPNYYDPITKIKKMYFFNKDVDSLSIIILLLRMVGVLLIGQKIWAISQPKEGDVHFYFCKKIRKHKLDKK